MSIPKFELANMRKLQSKDPTLALLIMDMQSGELPGNSLDGRKDIAKVDQYILQVRHFISFLGTNVLLHLSAITEDINTNYKQNDSS